MYVVLYVDKLCVECDSKKIDRNATTRRTPVTEKESECVSECVCACAHARDVFSLSCARAHTHNNPLHWNEIENIKYQ